MKPSRRARLSPLPWYERVFTASWTVFLGLSILTVLLSCLREPIKPNALGWRSCTGQVLTAQVRTVQAWNQTWYQPRVEYQYHAGDRTRTSTKVQRQRVSFPTQEEAQEWLAQYPPGAEVTVYFRNRMENRPLLDRGFTLRWILFFGALTAVALGVVGLRYQMHRNTVAYRGGLPPKEATERTPRPIRAAGDGEVRPGEGYERTLRGMIQPTKAYRKFL